MLNRKHCAEAHACIGSPSDSQSTRLSLELRRLKDSCASWALAFAIVYFAIPHPGHAQTSALKTGAVQAKQLQRILQPASEQVMER